MSEFKAQARPDRASQQSDRTISRHRAEPARPATAWGRLTGSLPSFGRRAAVLTTAAAVLVGVGAAGQAADQAAPSAAPTAAATADAGQTLSFDKTLISALPAPSAAALSAQSSDQAATKSTVAKATAAKATAAKKAAAAKAAAAEAAAAKATAAKNAAAANAAAVAKANAAAAKAVAAKTAAAAKAKAAAPVALNDPAGAKAYAASKLGSFGWAPDQMQCLKRLWTKESEWRTTATNASSGAYGIVQSLPAEKMATAGADYRTNYRTQINWGLDYIKERYDSPCGALNWHLAHNWY
ncbi:UNVERIFIED_ORG: chemotaxis protein histidine kinase CheA [Arthrobacter globiformis]|nr:chemotaxis protein histidine kinase CheA [Arthrobacter globiformis]